MQTARDEYDTKKQKSKIKHVQGNKAMVTTLLTLADMIPDQDGLSVLRGALKLVFQLLKKRIDNREQILTTFEDIPTTLSRACEAVAIHHEDNALRGHVENLYQVLRNKMPRLIEILNRQHKGSLTARLFKQHPEQEAAVINDCIEAIARASRKVSDRVDTLIDKTVSIETIQVEIEQRSIAREEQHSQSLDVLAGVIDSKIQDATTKLRSELQMLQTLLRDSLIPNSRPTSSTVYSHLLFSLDLQDLLFLAADVRQVVHASSSLPGFRQGSWLLVTPRFRSWIQPLERRSDLILVNGYLGTMTPGKISALSTITAIFAGMRKLSPQLVVLYHFCGLHSHLNIDTVLSGPRGLLLSLAAQLIIHLDQQQHSTNSLIAPFQNMNGRFFQDVAKRDLAALCHLFSELVNQLDHNVTLYCILDGISDFETSLGGWEEELCLIVEFLQSMVVSMGSMPGKPVFKVMMTAAHRSIAVYRHVSADNQISLSSGNLLPSSGHHSLRRNLQVAMTLNSYK
ncbi:hypothetical protein B0T17DRAFT_655176 [Bombardia bombarda]|uniref:Nephrocystin 3-like N-terminal domain-containing protein n=1 Tax=Bombardia bombarda TaxID=252184 RepID=A0AA40C546_9PEZI|nr:hypothetical protein B0T17DRAFT_655176 [Bombardia bombarda]